MIANSMTVMCHPQELLRFIKEMGDRGVYVINSAVFHSGFLVGGGFFDYRAVSPGIPDDDKLLEWRAAFFDVCREFKVRPAEACVRFALGVPGVGSIALNTTHAKRVKENIELAAAIIPPSFWQALRDRNLISMD